MFFESLENCGWIGPKIKALAVIVVLVALGWQGHRTFVYAADIYEKSQACERSACLSAVEFDFQAKKVERELQVKEIK